MRFTNRWEEAKGEDGLWITKDNQKYGNGAYIIQFSDDEFLMGTFRQLKNDAVSLQTTRNFPKSLKDAKELAEEFIERLEKFNG